MVCETLPVYIENGVAGRELSDNARQGNLTGVVELGTADAATRFCR